MVLANHRAKSKALSLDESDLEEKALRFCMLCI